jgi:hypothetical protein
MPKALINGQSYNWANVVVNILGQPVIGISAISYKEDEEMEEVFGAGQRAVARGYGNITNEGSLTLHMNEIESLQASSPDGRLQSIPEFDIEISYIPFGNKIVNHTLKNCKFKSNGRNLTQGSKNVEHEIPLQIGEVLWK